VAERVTCLTLNETRRMMQLSSCRRYLIVQPTVRNPYLTHNDFTSFSVDQDRSSTFQSPCKSTTLPRRRRIIYEAPRNAIDYHPNSIERVRADSVHTTRLLTEHYLERIWAVESERNESQAERDQLRTERDRIQAELNQMRAERHQLYEERRQLQLLREQELNGRSDSATNFTSNSSRRSETGKWRNNVTNIE
jgi:hypothetical protein